ncbi:hypothetical protein ET334_18705, partial [Salmonella enterica]|nr:hypothetical protein [Salmonella enterica]
FFDSIFSRLIFTKLITLCFNKSSGVVILKRNRKFRVKCNNAEMRYACRFLTQAAAFFFYFF